MSSTGKTVVDKTVQPILYATNNNDGSSAEVTQQSPQSTPSSRDNIQPSIERLHRLHGTSILLDTSTLLRLSASTYATSCTILHRTYHRLSLCKNDVWSVAMGCILLASKVEEESSTTDSRAASAMVRCSAKGM